MGLDGFQTGPNHEEHFMSALFDQRGEAPSRVFLAVGNEHAHAEGYSGFRSPSAVSLTFLSSCEPASELVSHAEGFVFDGPEPINMI